MPYNISLLTSGNGPLNYICESSVVSNNFLAYAILVIVLVIPSIWLFKKGKTIYTIMPSTLFLDSIVATLMWAIKCSENMLEGWIVVILWVTTGLFLLLRIMLGES